MKKISRTQKEKSQALSLYEVKHTANLANLQLSEKDLLKFQKQLSEVLNYVKKLQKVQTEKVKPTNWSSTLSNIFREDKILPSLPQKTVLSGAKQIYKGYFKINSIF